MLNGFIPRLLRLRRTAYARMTDDALSPRWSLAIPRDLSMLQLQQKAVANATHKIAGDSAALSVPNGTRSVPNGTAQTGSAKTKQHRADVAAAAAAGASNGAAVGGFLRWVFEAMTAPPTPISTYGLLVRKSAPGQRR
jgi:hypothetical protein